MDWHEFWEQVLQAWILLQVGAVCTLAVGYLGLGSGTRIQLHGDWLNDRFLGLFPCFMSTAFLSQWEGCFLLLP